MNYIVTITEYLERYVPVTADSIQEALDKVYAKYDNGEIVLDVDDYTDTDFNVEEDN